MIEKPFVGAYWKARRESRQECARRIFNFLQSVQPVAGLSRWYLKAYSRKAANVPVEISPDAIGRHLETNNNETDGSPILDLGFGFDVWNGSDAAPAGFRATCGVNSIYVNNAVVLRLPRTQVPQDAAACAPFRGLLEKMIAAFDPDDAVVSSSESLSRSGTGMPWEKGGWLVYHRGQPITVKV